MTFLSDVHQVAPRRLGGEGGDPWPHKHHVNPVLRRHSGLYLIKLSSILDLITSLTTSVNNRAEWTCTGLIKVSSIHDLIKFLITSVNNRAEWACTGLIKVSSIHDLIKFLITSVNNRAERTY